MCCDFSFTENDAAAQRGEWEGEEELLLRKRANHCAAPLLWCGHQGEGHRVNHGSALNLHLHPPLYRTAAAVFCASLQVEHAGGEKLQRAARLRKSAVKRGCRLDRATATREERVWSRAEQPAPQCWTLIVSNEVLAALGAGRNWTTAGPDEWSSETFTFRARLGLYNSCRSSGTRTDRG